jgi:hypothetical protein
VLNFIKSALSTPKTDMLRAITPANHADAKKEWLEQAKKGHFTNPQFTYSSTIGERKAALNEWNELCAQWKKFAPQDKREQILYDLANDYIERQRQIRLIAFSIASGDDGLTDGLMSKYYGPTSDDLIKLAYKLANGAATVDFPLLNAMVQKLTPNQAKDCLDKEYEAADIKRFFDAVLEDYGLQDTWKVVVDDEHSAICVTSLTLEGDSRIFIPRNRKVNEIKAIQLAGHEIECHVRHNENCISLLQDSFDIPRDIAAKLVTDRDGTITEGFAKISDAIISKRCLGTTDGTPQPWYIIMADLAAKGESFAQITERVHEEWGVSLESCFTHAIRIFRGCHDTKNPHHFSRQSDRSYLEGYVRAIELSEKDSPLYDFAKFDEALMQKITEQIGEPTARLPHLGITTKIVNNL